MKNCIGCKVIKAVSEFYDSKNTTDGKNRYCKLCCKVNRGVEAVRKRDKRSKVSRRQIHRCLGLGVKVDRSVDLVGLFKRDQGTCAICKKWVQPRSASIDHEPPVSKGGSHTWEGVQLVHLKCNLRKGDR